MQSIDRPAIAGRVRRGLELHRERGEEIEHLGHGVYEVPGSNGWTYTVHLDVFGEGESCGCPDHERHPEFTCKHITAATICRAKTKAQVRRAQRQRHDARAVTANLDRLGA